MHHDAILVTGGAGFIGSHFVRDWLAVHPGRVVNLDNLTYAADAAGLEELQGNSRHFFVRGDIGDESLVSGLLERHRPSAVINLAAETHVDRSIDQPAGFIRTNVVATMGLLQAVRRHWQKLDASSKARFRLLHVSTDEVFGSLQPGEARFSEQSRHAPNNPYAASKASSDCLVRAWHHTYGLPTITLNCSNHFGPRQNSEKFIPRLVTCAIAGEPMPVYGDGANERDWLYVSDGCAAMRLALMSGSPGQTYAIGTGTGTTNIDVARKLCILLDELAPRRGSVGHEGLLRFVPDRPGHDRRYAVDAAKLRTLTGWTPSETLDSGLRKTVTWYLQRSAAAGPASTP